MGIHHSNRQVANTVHLFMCGCPKADNWVWPYLDLSSLGHVTLKGAANLLAFINHYLKSQ